MSDLELDLDLVRFRVARTAHIVVDEAVCSTCGGKDCLYFCPAGCFVADGETVTYSYEGCLECGTCRLACPQGAVTEWDYPLGGRGVAYRLG